MSKKPYDYTISADEYKKHLLDQQLAVIAEVKPKSKRKTKRKTKPKKMTDPHTAKELKKLNPSVYKLYRRYRREVDRLTKLQPLETLENFDKRGFRSYHVDHKVSVWHGFKNNIHPASIAHISNLQVVPYQKNLNKGHKNEGQMIIL